MDNTNCPSNTMSPSLAAQVDILRNEVGELQYRFDEFEKLFCFSKARIDMLNEVAPIFFNMVAEALWGDLLMHLTRVTGPSHTGPKSKRFENLSIQRLPSLIDDVDIRGAVQTVVDEAITAADFAENGRNKFYAHRDLHVALDADSSGIRLGSRREMRAAIEATTLVFEVLAQAYKRKDVYIHDLGWGVAEDLVQVMEAGLKAQQRSSSS